MRFEVQNTIRPEDIYQFFKTVFTQSENEEEGEAVGSLARDILHTVPKDDFDCFQAWNDNRLIACIIITRLSYPNEQDAFLLSPVAVHTDDQRRGLGQAIIRWGITKLQEKNAEILVTYGDPHFYSKIGFEPVSTDDLEAPYPLSFPHGWQAVTLNRQAVLKRNGTPKAVAPFDNPGLW